MSTEPISPQNDSKLLIPKSDRLHFCLYFISFTVLAQILVISPIYSIQELIRIYYESITPEWMASPSINAIGLLDIVSHDPPIQGRQIWFGLLMAVAIRTLFGIFVGVAQWFALREYLPDRKWVLATVVGYILFGLITWYSFNPAIYYGALLIGFCQWFVLTKVVKKAWNWIIIYPLSLVLGRSFQVLGSAFQIGVSEIVYFAIALMILQLLTLCSFKRISH